MEDKAKIVEIEDVTVDGIAAKAERGETIVLARGGRPVAAVMDVAVLRRLTEERELLRRLALGELESAGGDGEDLDVVLEDCRLLLEEN
jgi:antitoxin (DNA-binding transcriptional repressor) of toxin-antitoxin stability system